ncbi:unnamed protein product [Prorocentrum cordatum]|uniref:ATPase AAA-type core domain-containing protein n=1 Tax=Prorocentrum cordatum TaxID=2364126 RepID=A0ABN9TNG1_9DINO|nr:unnamed protein product [Polarella glacialis]
MGSSHSAPGHAQTTQSMTLDKADVRSQCILTDGKLSVVSKGVKVSLSNDLGRRVLYTKLTEDHNIVPWAALGDKKVPVEAEVRECWRFVDTDTVLALAMRRSTDSTDSTVMALIRRDRGYIDGCKIWLVEFDLDGNKKHETDPIDEKFAYWRSASSEFHHAHLTANAAGEAIALLATQWSRMAFHLVRMNWIKVDVDFDRNYRCNYVCMPNLLEHDFMLLCESCSRLGVGSKSYELVRFGPLIGSSPITTSLAKRMAIGDDSDDAMCCDERGNFVAVAEGKGRVVVREWHELCPLFIVGPPQDLHVKAIGLLQNTATLLIRYGASSLTAPTEDKVYRGVFPSLAFSLGHVRTLWGRALSNSNAPQDQDLLRNIVRLHEDIEGMYALKSKIACWLNSVLLNRVHASRGDAKHGDRESITFEHLNIALEGNPGCGKSTVARLLGQLLSNSGIICPHAKFIEATKADMVGRALGETPQIMTAFLERCKGNVIFFDEADQFY